MYADLQSSADLLRMLYALTQARREILARCARMSAEQLLDPVYAETWSILKNLAHLAWAEEYMLSWIGRRPGILPAAEFPVEPPIEFASVSRALDESHAAAIAFLKANPESVLREPCQYGRRLVQTTVGGVFYHLVEHEIHHRGFILHKLEHLKF
jgi:uncharacterized damage-inducible protein DinB